MDPRIEQLLDDLGTPPDLRPSLREALAAAGPADAGSSLEHSPAAGCD